MLTVNAVDDDALLLYSLRFVELALFGVIMIRGTVAKAALKVIVTKLPVTVQPVPEVIVTVPEVSLPITDTVGAVHAATAAAIVGVVPPVTICPLTVMLPVKIAEVTVRIPVEPMLAKTAPVELCACSRSAV